MSPFVLLCVSSPPETISSPDHFSNLISELASLAFQVSSSRFQQWSMVCGLLLAGLWSAVRRSGGQEGQGLLSGPVISPHYTPQGRRIGSVSGIVKEDKTHHFRLVVLFQEGENRVEGGSGGQIHRIAISSRG